METQWRITTPNSNKLLRISDLVARLGALQQQHGDLPCYIYSADKRASVPLLALSLTISSTDRTLSISAPIGSVLDEMFLDLIEERRTLLAPDGPAG